MTETELQFSKVRCYGIYEKIGRSDGIGNPLKPPHIDSTLEKNDITVIITPFITLFFTMIKCEIHTVNFQNSHGEFPKFTRDERLTLSW